MRRLTRRRLLLGLGALAACGLGAAAGLSGSRWYERPLQSAPEAAPAQPPRRWSIEARYYGSSQIEGTINCSACHGTTDQPLHVSYCHIPHTGTYVQCALCPHRCIIAEGERGLCRVREHRNGRLYSMVYGNPCSLGVDPIEKKPFYHFLPGATAFSLATAGCSLRCLYCQNWSISQVPPEETQNADLPPREVVRSAQQSNAPVIAYTYSEPTAFFEYMLDTAILAREAGLHNVVVSSGFINPDPLRELCQAVDAIKIDLKGFSEEFYRRVCSAELGPVLRAIEIVHEMGVHLEIVNLVVPTLNDDLAQLRALSRWLAREVSADVPLHFSRFFPQYKLLNLPPTPIETLEQARQVALEEGLRYVYVGNVPGHEWDSTYCPACKQAIILRQGFSVLEYHLKGSVCAFCGQQIPGVWWPGQSQAGPSALPVGQVLMDGRPG